MVEVYVMGTSSACNLSTAGHSRGIGMVHQHFMLAPSLTVTENLVLGLEPRKGLAFDWQKAVETVTALSRSTIYRWIR